MLKQVGREKIRWRDIKIKKSWTGEKNRLERKKYKEITECKEKVVGKEGRRARIKVGMVGNRMRDIDKI